MSGDIAGLYGGNAVPVEGQEAASGDFSPLPAGWYAVQINSAEIRDTKAGTGKYLKLAMGVIGERFNGRKLFTNINLVNPNPKAVEIGMREIAGLGQALSLTALEDTQQLIGGQVDVRVKVKKDTGYGEDNDVTAYAKVGTKSAAQPAPTQAAPATGGGLPWQK